MITGIALKELREKNNRMTQDELAARAKVTRPMVQQWENGSRISKGKLPILCEIFGVGPEVFETKIESKVDSEIMEEFKSTQEFLKEHILTLTKEKERLMDMLEKALTFNGNFPKDSIYFSLTKVEESESEDAILKTA